MLSWAMALIMHLSQRVAAVVKRMTSGIVSKQVKMYLRLYARKGHGFPLQTNRSVIDTALILHRCSSERPMLSHLSMMQFIGASTQQDDAIYWVCAAQNAGATLLLIASSAGNPPCRPSPL